MSDHARKVLIKDLIANYSEGESSSSSSSAAAELVAVAGGEESERASAIRDGQGGSNSAASQAGVEGGGVQRLVAGRCVCGRSVRACGGAWGVVEGWHVMSILRDRHT